MLKNQSAISVLSLITLVTLTMSCINVNMPGQSTGGATPGGSTTPPAGSKAATPPTVESFSANPENLLYGKSSTLSWSVKNADFILITPDIGKVPTTGTKPVKPDISTVYTLVASNAAGMAATSVTITVSTAENLQIGLQTFEGGTGGTQPGGQSTNTGRTVAGTLDPGLQRVSGPDLVPSQGNVFCDTVPSSPCYIRYWVQNRGNEPAVGFKSVLKIDGTTKETAAVLKNGLQPNETSQVAFEYKLTWDEGNTHRAEIIVDSANANAELDETNNTFTFLIPFK